MQQILGNLHHIHAQLHQPTGNNCFVGLDYRKAMLLRKRMFTSYQNVRLSLFYSTFEIAPATGDAPPTLACSDNFYNVATGIQVGVYLYDLITTDPDYIKFQLRLTTADTGLIDNPDIYNIGGYKYTYVLYSSYPKRVATGESGNFMQLHLATFQGMRDILSALNNDIIELWCNKPDIAASLRDLTPLNGYMSWSLYAIDEHGQISANFAFSVHTDEIE
jgi:hypothetical protein